MFNFIFDGKIGEMLAPVGASNKLFLAIQHHKNDEIASLVKIDGLRCANGTLTAFHVASRYNNRYAVDFLLSEGSRFSYW